jgi:tetratricopeptide (TPR) repeat protein
MSRIGIPVVYTAEKIRNPLAVFSTSPAFTPHHRTSEPGKQDRPREPPRPQHEETAMFKKFLLAAVLGCVGVAGSSGEAAAQPKKASTTNNKKIEALYKKAAEAMNEKDYEGAMEIADQIIELDVNQSDAWGLKAFLHNRAKEYKQGEKAAKKAVALNDSYTFGWFELGYAQLNLKKLDEAEESFEKVLELNPKFWIVYDALVLISDTQGRDDDAEKWKKLKKQRMAKEKKATPPKDDDDN